ncbi:MAG: hypothetical protein IPI64_03795 [Chloracidobacterium sp.]|nr:hypothetical protein [Chloracidobacterium sp.]
MKTVITSVALFVVVSLMLACGGKTESKQNETKTTPAVSNINATTPTASNVSVASDGDRDDIRSPAANNTNAANTKTADRDDVRSNRPANSKQPKKIGDADDRGKKDSDGDDDDR